MDSHTTTANTVLAEHHAAKMAWAIKTKLGIHILYIWHRSACIDPEVKRSNVKVTCLRKRHGRMAAAACGRCATSAGMGLHIVW